jgi:hypothetical protein
MNAACRHKGGDTLWRRAQPRDWLRMHAFRRWDNGLRNATIPSSQFRAVYRRFVDELGAERGRSMAALFWPPELGPMPAPAGARAIDPKPVPIAASAIGGESC